MFEVLGCDDSFTVLVEFDNSAEAIQWARRYVDYDNAGGWERIIVNDARGEAGETVWSWEITDDDA